MANRVGSKRRPYPYDLYLGGIPVKLIGEGDNLVSQKSKTLDATAPVDYTYSSANPYKERVTEWQKLYGGLGQAEAPDTAYRRYSYAEYLDTSIDGLEMLGPGFEAHVETIDAAAGEVRQLVKALHSGALTVFAICENGIYRRISDGSWTGSLTLTTSPALPAGTHPQSGLRFKHRGASSVDALYVGTDNTNLYKYDGTTWTVAASAAGPGTGTSQGEARYLERVGDELWVAGNYWIVKVEDDPMDRTKYAGVIYIGDQTAKITFLKQIGNTLVIHKEDGTYTVSAAGVDVDLFPTLRGKNNPKNGRNAAVWIDRMWFTFGDQTFTMTADATLKPDGLEQMLENISPVRGSWVAGAGHNTWFFYELYYNAAVNTTYLVKHGTWVEEGSSSDNPGVAVFADAHHGSLYQWNKQATMCDVISGLHTGGNDRLYVGFTDGTIQWTPLPRYGPNPAEDSNCEFTTNTGYLNLPIHHSGFRSDNKLFHAVTAMGPRLTTGEWVEIEYRLDVNNDLAAWTTLSADDPKFTLPSQRKEFSTDETIDPVYGKLLQVRVAFMKDPNLSVSPRNLTPMIYGVGIHESIRPSFSREFTFTVDCTSYAPLKNGNVDRRRGVDISDAIIQVCAEVGPVVVMLPWGTSEEMTITDFHDTLVQQKDSRDFKWGIQVTAIQLRTISHEQVFSGLTYDTLELYTLDELEAIL
jgi:hypothetical protein